MSRWWPPLLLAVLMAGASAFLLHAFHRHATRSWLSFGSHPEILGALEQSLEDQKDLAALDPESRDQRRRRFDETQTLLQRLTILEHSREQMARRYETVLLVLFGTGVLLTLGFMVRRARQEEQRLQRLGTALGDLAAGRTDLRLGESSGDTLGRIARMIEQPSRRMARDRRRLRSLENLSAWQEAARRHAHEMKTPLTGARLELERLKGLLTEDGSTEDAAAAAQSVRQELDRLGRFTQEFTSFARLPRPSFSPLDLDRMMGEFVQIFDAAWPKLELVYAPSPVPTVDADQDQLRQVLVNLCDNAALALESNPPEDDSPARVTFELGQDSDQVWLQVADNGPGVPDELRNRIFEPYVTTRGIGKGMGLGLAICRKILLDHGGDLELLDPTGTGAIFRLSLPLPQDAPGT